ncbi:ABC-type transport system, permease subunit [Candidatus Moduliflexus flocculans]|uniref:ABC-type transport system, permease subunit n=1 Tax=Candidatus Moduliflexus flocculans TaxID=1499966 RepID=A0A0S6VX99_9BACT|nr:ABC-type transport system, permease subunit [Candidatus Moduliflexus flocculans]
MNYLLEAFYEAIHLIFSLDPEVLNIAATSVYVSAIAIVFASVTAVPLGFIVGISQFYGRGTLITLLNTSMAIPTVVIGLLGYALISRQGLLGDWNLLFTPQAMMLGQYILATPMIMALTVSATQGVDPRVRKTAIVLGANSFQSAMTILSEARFALMAAIISGFGRIIGEVGASMMLGGNIKGYTRNLATAIALETSKGEFGFGLALGLILLAIALFINMLLRFLQQKV